MKGNKIIKRIWICCIICIAGHMAYGQNAVTLDKQFSKVEPGPSQLNMYEQRAIQKLEDYGAYFKIIRSEETEEEFRIQAQNMLADLFTDERRSLHFTLSNDKILASVKQCINASAKELQSVPMFQLSSTSVSVGLMKQSFSGNYTGVLEMKLYSVENDQEKFVAKLHCNMVLEKSKVQFGKNERIIWKVRLGDFFYEDK